MFEIGEKIAKKSIYKKSLMTTAAAICLGSIFLDRTALAQDSSTQTSTAANLPSEPTSGLETVVVTARKREENLLIVPVAVQTMSDATIADANVTDLRSLSDFTPGLYASTDASGGKPDRSQVHLTFRGLSTDSGSIFIDGAPYTGTATPDLTDVQRVEVLNGPQSVYFGRSTFSGAVNFVTEAPSDEFNFKAMQEFTDYEGFDTRAAAEGPLIGDDLLNGRISLRHYSFGGQYTDIISGARLGAELTDSGSIALASSPFPNLKLSAYYSLELDDDGPPPNATIGPVGPGTVLNCNLGGTGGNYYCGQLPGLSGISPSTIGDVDTITPYIRSELIDNVRGSPVPFPSEWLDHFGIKRQFTHAHFNADYATDSGWDAAALVALNSTRYAAIEGQEGRDTSNLINSFYPATPAALAAACAAGAANCYAPPTVELTTHQENIINDLSTDVRVSSPQDDPLRGTIGLSYYNVGGPLASNYGVQPSGRLINGGGGGLISHVNTPAIYAGLYYDVIDKLTLNAEARYQWDGITQQQVFPVPSAQLHQVFQSFSPRLTINYKVTPDQMVYATFSRGYKPGGFNPGLIGLSTSSLAQLSGLGGDISYKQEKLDNYEIGEKGTWFDNRLRTTLALYDMLWTNGQVPNSVFFNNNGSTASVAITENVGEVHLQGVELAVDAAVTDELTLSGTFDYAGNRIIKYVYVPNGPLIDGTTNVDGNSLPQVPKLNVGFSPSYRAMISNVWDWFARLDYHYQSKEYVDPTNVTWIGAQSIVNLHVGVIRNGNYKFEVYANNLFNDDTLQEAAKANESYLGANPAVTCPPCYTAAAPPVPSPGVSSLNQIFLGLPALRLVGVRASYNY